MFRISLQRFAQHDSVRSEMRSRLEITTIPAIVRRPTFLS
jgi:hypothetical protein